MKNSRFKKTLGLFIWMFIILFFFNTLFTWVNYYEFKVNSEQYQHETSSLIATDVKNKYQSSSKYIAAMNPFVIDTIKKSLYSIENELNTNGNHIDNTTLESLQREYNLTNIYVLDKDGIVQYSTDQREIGKYSRKFYSISDRQRWEKNFKKIVKTKGIYIEDKFFRSEMDPYRFYKWGYKGIGYIDNVGLVVLEVGVQVVDIKGSSVTPLIDQVKNSNEISKYVKSIKFVNLPPTKLHAKFKTGQYEKIDGDIVTKINMKGLDNSDVQAVITTDFSSIQNSIRSQFEHALMWTVFYFAFSFMFCLLFYYRFAIPVQFTDSDLIEKSIRNLDDLKK